MHQEDRTQTPTSEQQAILDHPYKPGDMVSVQAYAGSGKTSTIRFLCQSRPDVSFLVLAFNKEIANDIKVKLNGIANAECRTFDAKVYELISSEYEISNQGTTKEQLTNLLSPGSVAAGDNWMLVLRTLQTFCNQAARSTIESMDLPRGAKSFPLCEQVLRAARSAWKVICSPQPQKLEISHAMARKLVQVQGRSLGEYGFIVVDEGQDLNPVMQDIIRSQNRSVRITLGDAHQSIYSFMGCVNAMAQMRYSASFQLTNSFRFGTLIAAALSRILLCYKSHVVTLHGANPFPGVVHKIPADSGASLPKGTCFLFRNNISLLEKAASVGRMGKGYYVLGGKVKLQEMLQDVEALLTEYKTNRQGFYAHMARVRKGEEDNPASFAMRHISENSRSVEAMSSFLRAKPPSEEMDAHVILGTVHQAKGREFDNVVVGEDLKPKPCKQEECNILYVAASRAKKSLYLSAHVLDMLTSGTKNINKDDSKTSKNKPALKKNRVR